MAVAEGGYRFTRGARVSVHSRDGDVYLRIIDPDHAIHLNLDLEGCVASDVLRGMKDARVTP
jgi:hypothetical protein